MIITGNRFPPSLIVIRDCTVACLHCSRMSGEECMLNIYYNEEAAVVSGGQVAVETRCTNCLLCNYIGSNESLRRYSQYGAAQ